MYETRTESTGLINWPNRYCRAFSIFLKVSCLNNCFCLLFSECCLTTAGAEFHPEASCGRKRDFFRNSCPYLFEFPSGCKGSPAFLAGYKLEVKGLAFEWDPAFFPLFREDKAYCLFRAGKSAEFAVRAAVCREAYTSHLSFFGKGNQFLGAG